MMLNKKIQISRQTMIFWDQILNRMLKFTLAETVLFIIIYVVDYSVEYQVYESISSGAGTFTLVRMPVPQEVLIILFIFTWLIGAMVICWYSISHNQRLINQLEDKTTAAMVIEKQLQKTIQKRYQLKFWGSMGLYSLIMAMIAGMIFLVEKSRVWYATDPLYPILKFMKDLSPYAAVVIWVAGVILLLFHQWKRSAADTVGLINSIVQMQTEQEDLDISVPNDLIEIKPVLQEMLAERQQSRQFAEALEQRKKELIVYIAHDIKTPLTSVIGYLSLLTEEPEMAPEKNAEYIKIALDKALRLESLINQFFEISRFNLHKMVLEKTQFDLNYLLFQLVDEFYPLLEPQKKTIDLQLPEQLWVDGDADKLARVFNNILRNAAAYSESASSILIKASQDEAQTEIEFVNQGKEIPEEQLKKIFSKFFRLDGARNSDTGGAGLGLAIAQEIVLLHGGTIAAQSSDQLVTFTVRLPRT